MFVTIMYLVVLLLPEVHFQGVSSRDLIEFCQNNGKRKLAIASFDMNVNPVEAFVTETMKGSSSLQLLTTRFVSMHYNQGNKKFVADHIDYEQETLVLVGTIFNINAWDHYVSIVSQTRVRSGILVIVEPVLINHEDVILTKLQTYSENSYFYMVYKRQRQEDNSSNWDKVITLRNYYHPIINPIEFDNFGRMITKYDLNGVHIKCCTLSWAPYLILSDCVGPNKVNCSSTGYLADLMDNLGRMMNFTWICDAEPDHNWGTLPISGVKSIVITTSMSFCKYLDKIIFTY